MKKMDKGRAEDLVFTGCNGFAMLLLVFLTGYPILHLLYLSLSSAAVGNEFLLAPRGFTLRYYREVLADQKVLHAGFISMARTVLGTGSMLLITSAGAFAMADRQLVGHKALWRYYLIPMFISGGMIPSYLLMKQLCLTGTFWIYILPSLFGGTYNMILMKTFMEQLPTGLVEAAEIDGANDISVFFRIALPLSLPILATVGLFSAVGHWNAYTDTMLYCAENENLHTLQYSLMLLLNRYSSSTSIESIRNLAKENGGAISPIGLKSALTFVTILPIMCVYPFLQKYFVKGLLVGAIKA
ncbi:MAG: carbohydrate ABC transporter permease [Eubacteriales bacterium]|nr:carbohydrate ABC transporter permease [Eubacteriales bacterium]